MQNFFIFLLAYLLYSLFSIFFHSFKSSTKPLNLNLNLNIKYLFSPSYFFAKLYKQNLSREDKTNLLKFWNHLNFVFTVIFSILLFTIGLLQFNIFYIDLKKFKFILLFITFFWGIRCISRSLEIIFAFFKDITTDENNSNLSKYDRIKLATISYLEVILNFGILYFLIFNSVSDTMIFYSEITSLIATNIPKNPYYSNNLIYFIFSSFFISTGTKIVGINPFFILQLSTSLSLLIFAIAGYISDVKNISAK